MVPFYPITKVDVFGTHPLTVHASLQAVMPRGVYPGRELAEPFVVEGNAPFSPDEKTVRIYCPGRTSARASLTVLATASLPVAPPAIATR